MLQERQLCKGYKIRLRDKTFSAICVSLCFQMHGSAFPVKQHLQRFSSGEYEDFPLPLKHTSPLLSAQASGIPSPLLDLPEEEQK